MPRFNLAAVLAVATFATVCHDVTDPRDDVVAEIRITPATDTIAVDDTAQFQASALNRRGQPVPNATISWSTSDSLIAIALPNGRVIGVRRGSVRLLAQVRAGSFDSVATVPVEVAPPQVPSCRQAGTVHTGTIGQQTWVPADNPHHVRDTLRVVQELRVDAGALLCMGPGAAIRVGAYDEITTQGKLVVGGRADLPVVLTAENPSTPWAGIFAGSYRPTIALGYALVEHARTGVAPGDGHAYVQYTRFRQITSWAVDAVGRYPVVEILHSVFDTTGGIRLTWGVLENNVVRQGSVSIVGVNEGGQVSVLGGRIEGGSFVMTQGQIPPSIWQAKPLRIIGSRTPPVTAFLSAFLRIWPTRADEDSLLGNFNDTLRIYGNHIQGPNLPAVSRTSLTLRPEFVWQFALADSTRFYDYTAVAVDTLVVEAGARVLLGLDAFVSSKLQLTGTSAAPVALTCRYPIGAGPCALELFDTAAHSSTVSHAQLSNVFLRARGAHLLAIDHLRSTGNVTLAAAGSSVLDSEIKDYQYAPRTIWRCSGAPAAGGCLSTPDAALVLASDAARIERCVISGNSQDGILVLAGAGIQIHDCNIEQNRGFGVKNTSPNTVDARRNWWGDPAGPQGATGDGVFGAVDFSNWLSSRLIFQ